MSDGVAIARKYWKACSAHDFDAAVALCTNDYVHHDEGLPVKDSDVETWRATIEGGFVQAFPDLTIHVRDVIGSGDTVAVRWGFSGTHSGEMPGEPPLPATGNKVNVKAMAFHRLADGKIAETWVVFDAMTMMQQLGVA